MHSNQLFLQIWNSGADFFRGWNIQYFSIGVKNHYISAEHVVLTWWRWTGASVYFLTTHHPARTHVFHDMKGASQLVKSSVNVTQMTSASLTSWNENISNVYENERSSVGHGIRQCILMGDLGRSLVFSKWLANVCRFWPSVLHEKLSYCCLLAWICRESLRLPKQY